MSSDKNKYDKAYDEGYKEGKKGDFVDDFTQGLVKGYRIPGSDDKERQSYNVGYDDGASDRGNSSDSNSSNGGSDNDGGCFITTATLTSLGKSDNCAELEAFRNFRDKWLLLQPDGTQLISEYYAIAPQIVAKIDLSPDRINIYRDLWANHLKPCLNLLTEGRFVDVKILYQGVITDLKNRFLS